jgi:hypothetical protein
MAASIVLPSPTSLARTTPLLKGFYGKQRCIDLVGIQVDASVEWRLGDSVLFRCCASARQFPCVVFGVMDGDAGDMGFAGQGEPS